MTTQQTAANVFEQKLKDLEQVADSRDAAKDGARTVNRKADAKRYEAVYIYATSTDKERIEHDGLIDAVANKRKIRFKDGTPQHNRITRLSLGKDKSQTSDKTRCFNAALVDGIDPAGYVDWIEKITERVIKATRHMDGTVRKDPRTISPNKQQKKDLINRTNAELNNKEIAKFKIKDVDKPKEKTECVVMGYMLPNGTFVAQAVLTDKKLNEAAHVTYAQGLPEQTEEELIQEGTEQLLQKKVITKDQIEAKLGKDIADECQRKWDGVSSKYELDKDQIDPVINEYLDLIAKGDRVEGPKPDGGTEYYALAVKLLFDLQDDGMQISHLFDRDFDITTNADAESVPRLLTSLSQHKLTPCLDSKTWVYKDFLKNGLTDYLQARDEVEPEPTAAQMAHMQEMKAMASKHAPAR